MEGDGRLCPLNTRESGHNRTLGPGGVTGLVKGYHYLAATLGKSFPFLTQRLSHKVEEQDEIRESWPFWQQNTVSSNKD